MRGGKRPGSGRPVRDTISAKWRIDRTAHELLMEEAKRQRIQPGRILSALVCKSFGGRFGALR